MPNDNVSEIPQTKRVRLEKLFTPAEFGYG